MLAIAKVKLILVSVLTMSLVLSCNQIDNSQRQKTIKKIENTIKIPENSYSLSSYSRFYFFDEKSIVVSIYMIQDIRDRKSIKDECSKLRSNYSPCNDVNYGIIGAGETKIVNKFNELPIQNGGGCSYIEIKYDIQNSKFLRIECNGPY